MKTITVESHAGSQAEEYPVRFTSSGRRVEITAIKKRWLTPDAEYFEVAGDDGYSYVLEYRRNTDTWSLLTINRP